MGLARSHEALQSLQDSADVLQEALDYDPHAIPVATLEGQVESVSGLTVSLKGFQGYTAIGDRVTIVNVSGKKVQAEIIAFKGGYASAMVFESLSGIGTGCKAYFSLYDKQERQKRSGGVLTVSDSWEGRMLDPMGRPLDGGPPLEETGTAQHLHAHPPQAGQRARLGPRIDLGIRAMNLFTTCRQGQRLGLFAGSGVGKSTLMGMLARYTACDVAVVALVGERGREVREFVEDDLGPEGMKKSVVIVATSDTSPLMRREAAYAAMSVAEYFRDRGKSVLFLMDSVTRFCQALREIGLSSGEPPATRGYPPSVFAQLPKLLERAGPGEKTQAGRAGQVTALFSVLVEGDDLNEPIADAVRGILDGHVVLDRKIAEAGRYPAVDVLRSLSRTVPGCLTADENQMVQKARSYLATWDEMQDMVRLGAYHKGSDPQVDEAVQKAPRIEDVLKQPVNERADLAQSFQALSQALTG